MKMTMNMRRSQMCHNNRSLNLHNQFEVKMLKKPNKNSTIFCIQNLSSELIRSFFPKNSFQSLKKWKTLRESTLTETPSEISAKSTIILDTLIIFGLKRKQCNCRLVVFLSNWRMWQNESKLTENKCTPESNDNDSVTFDKRILSQVNLVSGTEIRLNFFLRYNDIQFSIRVELNTILLLSSKVQNCGDVMS